MIVATSRKLILAVADANQICKEFEILGVAQAAMQPRQVKKKEVQRLTTALVCVKLLSCLKLGFAEFHRAARSYALSKCVYGWISRAPTLAICHKMVGGAETSYRPSVLEVPLNPVSKRFGWFQRGENLDNGAWCAKVADKIWERRFDALGVG